MGLGWIYYMINCLFRFLDRCFALCCLLLYEQEALISFQIIWRQGKLIQQLVIPFKGHFPQISQEFPANGDRLDDFPLGLVIVFMSGAVFAQPDHSRGKLPALHFDASRVIWGLSEECACLETVEFIDLWFGLEGRLRRWRRVGSM